MYLPTVGAMPTVGGCRWWVGANGECRVKWAVHRRVATVISATERPQSRMRQSIGVATPGKPMGDVSLFGNECSPFSLIERLFVVDRLVLTPALCEVFPEVAPRLAIAVAW